MVQRQNILEGGRYRAGIANIFKKLALKILSANKFTAAENIVVSKSQSQRNHHRHKGEINTYPARLLCRISLLFCLGDAARESGLIPAVPGVANKGFSITVT